MKRVPKWKLILEAVCCPRSSLHSYLKSCQPPSSELVAGVALVARLTALLDQFPQQVFIEPRLLSFSHWVVLFWIFCKQLPGAATRLERKCPPSCFTSSHHWVQGCTCGGQTDRDLVGIIYLFFNLQYFLLQVLSWISRERHTSSHLASLPHSCLLGGQRFQGWR